MFNELSKFTQNGLFNNDNNLRAMHTMHMGRIKIRLGSCENLQIFPVLSILKITKTVLDRVLNEKIQR